MRGVTPYATPKVFFSASVQIQSVANYRPTTESYISSVLKFY